MSASVLMYHSLDDGGSVISTSPRDFQRQMDLLHQGGHNVISFGQLAGCLRERRPLPERSVVITFDDGFNSVYAVAAPVLAHYGFPATVFLVAGYCGKTNDWPSQPPGLPRMPLMTWSQARELDRQGFEFGAHTCTHPRLDLLADDEHEYELVESKTFIEDKLGHSVELFSYPYGRVSQSSAAIVQQTYLGACTTRLGTVKDKSEPLAIQRIDAHYLRRPQIFKMLSSPALTLYLGLRRPVHSAASSLLNRQWA
jgi:peptidoglycan/xylan/chitin deacetylase (PgdA/CDA1 family)